MFRFMPMLYSHMGTHAQIVRLSSQFLMDGRNHTFIALECLVELPPLSCPTPGKTVPPPLPGGQLPSDPLPPLPGTALPPDTHIFRHRIALQNERIQWQHAHKRCDDMHHRALNIQRPAPKQVPLCGG